MHASHHAPMPFHNDRRLSSFRNVVKMGRMRRFSVSKTMDVGVSMRKASQFKRHTLNMDDLTVRVKLIKRDRHQVCHESDAHLKIVSRSIRA